MKFLLVLFVFSPLSFAQPEAIAQQTKRPAESGDKRLQSDVPPFRNSIVSTKFDFIRTSDPTAFKSVRFVGRGTREMPDKRSNELFANDTFLFEATFNDGKVNIWVHRAFESREAATRYARMAAERLGRLPGFMRRRLSHVVIHKGDRVAFAESEGHFIVLYSQNMETRVRNHDLEETVFHEAVHATLDSNYSKSRAWLAAQKADGRFITEYAAAKPMKEDMAESALFAYTVQKHPGRLPPHVEARVHKHIPNRLAFFRRLFAELGKEQKKDPKKPRANSKKQVPTQPAKRRPA